MQYNVSNGDLTEQLFLENLKSDTAPMHRALEQTALSIDLMSPDVSRGQYTQYLRAMCGVIAFTESAIFPLVERVVPHLSKRKKLPALVADIRALTGAGKEETTSFKPFSLPVSENFALGFMYVIEGSTLGGRVILRHLQSRPFFSEHDASEFFAGYGAETGSLWKSFLAALSAHAVREGAQQEIIEGAMAGFESIRNYFTEMKP